MAYKEKIAEPPLDLPVWKERRVSKPPLKPKEAQHPITRHTGTLGFLFAFFFTIYVILIMKVVTFEAIYDNWLFGTYSVLVTTYVFSRFLLAYFHKAIAIDPAYEPSVAFVVPAKNEEENIYKAVRKFGEVDYPPEKIEVIAINDGSDDRTGEEMERAARDLHGKIAHVEVVHWEKNRGKRHGMAEGVKRAKNDIIIFIDSDSFLERDAVRHLVKYFTDRRVGAVSGYTGVENKNVNLLTEMQAIRYYISFSIYKAAESVFGAVTCCPGCCSAYRRSYLNEFIDEWLEQTFLGAPCTFGDDRSLTNYTIRKHLAVYCQEARATTVVPETVGKYMRQQQRWKKSWIRETFIAAGFMWRKHSLAVLSFYTYALLAFVGPVVFFRAVVWLPAHYQVWPVVYLLGLLLMLLLHGFYYRIRVDKETWFLGIMSFWLSTILLIWQLPWALVTIRDSRWGTR